MAFGHVRCSPALGHVLVQPLDSLLSRFNPSFLFHPVGFPARRIAWVVKAVLVTNPTREEFADGPTPNCRDRCAFEPLKSLTLFFLQVDHNSRLSHVLATPINLHPFAD